MLKVEAMILIFFLLINPVEAHVCDDVLRYDPIEIRAETQTVKIIEQGEFRIFLKNNYGSSIHNVRVIVPENLFYINITPMLIEKVAPGQKVFFSISVTVPKDMKPGTYPLVLKVDALEFEIAREVHVTIQVEREEAVVEIIPEDIPVATSIFPDVIEVEPGQNVEFRVYVRNGHTKAIHNISLFIRESKEYMIGASPPRAGNSTLAGHIWQAGRKSSF